VNQEKLRGRLKRRPLFVLAGACPAGQQLTWLAARLEEGIHQDFESPKAKSGTAKEEDDGD
jgi:hypothetical protein